MDEPTASLDLGNRLLVLDRVRRLREQGYGIVFSTHDPEQAHELATRVAVIADGRLAHGPPDGILTGAMLSAVYGVQVAIERTPSGRASYRTDGTLEAEISPIGAIRSQIGQCLDYLFDGQFGGDATV